MTNAPPIDASLHNATEAVRNGGQQAFDPVKDATQTLSLKAEETLDRTKEYVRQNPVPILIGSLIFGAAMGCIVALSRRSAPSLRERFMEDPMHTTRDMLHATFQPMGRRIHDGYDSMRDGAGRAYDSLQDRFPAHRSNSLGRQLVKNLKFW